MEPARPESEGSGLALPQKALTISLEPIVDAASLGREWKELEARSDASFFQSAGWICCWLSRLPPDSNPAVLRATFGGLIVGLAILVPCVVRRRGVISSNGLFLNETGRREYDDLTMEHNGFLADRRMADEVERRCLEWLIGNAQWDELYLSGVPSRYYDLAQRSGQHCWVRDRKPAYFIDLSAVRTQKDGFLIALSGNTRYQLRRSLRAYESLGPLRLEIAETIEQGLRFFEDLKGWHQHHWRARGCPGAFASPSVETFHHHLIRELFAGGEVQLIRIAAGDVPIGALYNFVHDGHVYCYQSGFPEGRDAHRRPGMVCHYLAIEENAQRGARIYDLLAGLSQFKRSFATGQTELLWLVMQRNRAQFRIEAWLRRLKSGMNEACRSRQFRASRT